METIGIILTSILSGFLLKRFQILNEEDASALNRLIIYFFIPVISLLHIPSLEISKELLWLTISPFIVFVCGVLYMYTVKQVSAIGESSCQSLILTCGISSTSFVGFPIFQLLYGNEGLALGVFLSLGGTILVFNTLGMIFLFRYSSKEDLNLGQLVGRLFRFFPFVIFILAIILNVSNVHFSPFVENILKLLASPFSVIALLAIGLQIELKNIYEFKFELVTGLFYKLILAPLIIYLIIWVLFGRIDILAKVCILGAGIGSMNAISVLAAEKQVQPKLSLMMPAIGIPISVGTLFLIDLLLSR